MIRDNVVVVVVVEKRNKPKIYQSNFFFLDQQMNTLEARVKKLWSNDQQHSMKQADDVEEVFLPDAHPKKRAYRSPYVRLLIRIILRCYQWTLKHKFAFLLLIFIIIPMGLYLLLLGLSNNSAFIPAHVQSQPYRVLLVVAHPDDECLFFAPTLRALERKLHAQLSLLVFSRGNHKGLGQIRATELLGSCLSLRIPQERCMSLDLPNIQDSPTVWWPEQQLIPIIDEHIRKWSIDFLISFDNIGISGHKNHQALSSAVRSITKNSTYTMIKMSYELISVSVLRKFSSFLDFYLTFISFLPRLLHSFLAYITPFNVIPAVDASRLLLINTPDDYRISRAAFSSHKTQYSWDRHLYLIASRYMFVNELKYIAKG